MVDQGKRIKPYDPTDRHRARARALWSKRYPMVALMGYLTVIALVMLYMNQTPQFSSDMSLVLPGSGSSSNFSLDEVGQANMQTRSPFSGGGFNPRVNYKEMLKSREVIAKAAELVNMPIEAFGMPKVKLTEQTSIIEVELRASSGRLAGEKSWALYHAFQNHLDQMRADETMRRDQSIRKVLDQYRVSLNEKRNALIAFQEQSLLVDHTQVDQLMSTLSDTKSRALFIKAELRQKEDFVNQLAFDLGVSPSLAGKAFTLQTDTQFRGHLRELEASATQFSEFRSMWGANHPKVKASAKRVAQAQDAAMKRSTTILGDVVARSLHSVNLEASPDRSRLFGALMDSYAQLQGKEAEARELEHSIEQLDAKLRIFARESKTLEELQREYDLAEAVFTSAAARLDAGKSDVFASYPVVQMMAAPNEPMQRKSPTMKVAILGLVVGFMFITISLLIVWQRSNIVRILLNQKDA